MKLNEMNEQQLFNERQRVKLILLKPKNYFELNQNKKYLERIEKRIKGLKK